MEALVADERRFVRLLIGAPRLGVLPTNSLSSGGEIIGVCGENRPFLPQNSRYSPRTQRYSRLLHYVTAFCRGLAIVQQQSYVMISFLFLSDTGPGEGGSLMCHNPPIVKIEGV